MYVVEQYFLHNPKFFYFQSIEAAKLWCQHQEKTHIDPIQEKIDDFELQDIQLYWNGEEHLESVNSIYATRYLISPIQYEDSLH